MARSNQKQIQGPSMQHGAKLYQVFQDMIFRETGIDCKVFVKAEPGAKVSIQTADLADFYLARSVIKGMTSLPIERDLFPMKPLDERV